MPFGFSSSSNSSGTSQKSQVPSNQNAIPTPTVAAAYSPHPTSQPVPSQSRINQVQATKGQRSISSNSSLPRTIRSRISTGNSTSTGTGIGPDSIRERNSLRTNGSIGLTSRTKSFNGGGESPRTYSTQTRSSTEIPLSSSTKNMTQTVGKSKNIERSIGSPPSTQAHLQSSEDSKSNSGKHAPQVADRQTSESSGIVQRSNSFSKPNKNKTSLLWRLRSPPKVKDGASRTRDRDQFKTSTTPVLKSPSGSITSANRTRISAKASLDSGPKGPNKVNPAVSQGQEPASSPVSVLRSRSTVDRFKPGGLARDHKDGDEAEGEGETKGMSRSWSTDLPTATRKIVSNGLVLPSVKYPIHIASPSPSPLPLAPDQDFAVWAGNHESAANAGITDFDSTTSAPIAPVMTVTTPILSASQSSSSSTKVPRISATFGSRANGADLPIPIFLNGIPRTNYSRPMHHRSLSYQSTASSVSSSSSAAALAASEAILEFTTNNHSDSQNGSRRNSTLLPSMMNPTVLARSRHRPCSIRSNSSSEMSKSPPVHDRTEEISTTKLPVLGRNSSRSSSRSRYSSISTNSSMTSLSVKDSNGHQPNSNYSTARFLRFSDLFPAPPNHPPFIRSRSNKGEALTPMSTPIVVERDLTTRQVETESTGFQHEIEIKSSVLDDVVAKDKDGAEALNSDAKDDPVPVQKDESTAWNDLGGGLYVCVSCVKHGYSSVSSSEDSGNPNGSGVDGDEEEEEEEEIIWKVVIKKKRPIQPPNTNLYADQTPRREYERKNNLGSSLNSSTNTTVTSTTMVSNSSKTFGSSAGIITPGQTPTKRTTMNDLHSVSPLHPTEAISPSTNNTLSLTLSLSPSTFSTTSGRLTFLPIPSLVPPSPTKEIPSLFKSSVSSSPTSLTSPAGAWSREQIDGTQRRSPAKNHTRARSEFGQGWSGRSPNKRPVSRLHERTWSDVGMGVGKGLSASPKHYSLKDLVGESG